MQMSCHVECLDGFNIAGFCTVNVVDLYVTGTSFESRSDYLLP